MANMLFEISYINKQGDIESLKRSIYGDEFDSMIHVMKYRTKKLSFMMLPSKIKIFYIHNHFLRVTVVFRCQIITQCAIEQVRIYLLHKLILTLNEVVQTYQTVIICMILIFIIQCDNLN